LQARGAEWLIVEVNDPFVSCVLQRADRLLATDRFQVVVDDLLGEGVSSELTPAAPLRKATAPLRAIEVGGT
jgi:hypothetical protein